MLTTSISVGLVLGVLVYIGWPLVRARAAIEDEVDVSLSPLERQKLDAYAAIKEAEFDLRTGKLSDGDFSTLTTKYRQQALAAIAAIEEARRRVAKPDRVRGARPARRMAFCPACGERVVPGANFCGGCGATLRDAAA